MNRSAVAKKNQAKVLLMMIQGRIVPSDEAKVSAHDRGLHFGDGVYEVVRSYAGKLWGFEQHMARLERSLREIEIDNVDLGKVRRWVLEAFDAVDRVDCQVYFQITRGCAIRAHVVPEPLEPQFLLMIKPPIDNDEKVRDGISAITYPEIRWKRCDIKSLNLLPNVLARRAAHRQGASEAIFIDQGFVTEGAVSSVFAIVGGKLILRPLDPQILPGITRIAIKGIAGKIGIRIEERPVSKDDFLQADEVFACGTGEEIRGVVKIDDQVIGQGRPGPITCKLVEFFVRHTRSGGTLDELLD